MRRAITNVQQIVDEIQRWSSGWEGTQTSLHFTASISKSAISLDLRISKPLLPIIVRCNPYEHLAASVGSRMLACRPN